MDGGRGGGTPGWRWHLSPKYGKFQNGFKVTLFDGLNHSWTISIIFFRIWEIFYWKFDGFPTPPPDKTDYHRGKSVLGIFPVLGHHAIATILEPSLSPPLILPIIYPLRYLLQHFPGNHFWLHGHHIHQFCLNSNLFHLHKLSCQESWSWSSISE